MPDASLCRTQEAQAALDQIADPGTRTLANMLLALIVQRAFGDPKIDTDMNIDTYFLTKVFEEYFSDRDAVQKALAIGGGKDHVGPVVPGTENGNEIASRPNETSRDRP